MVTPRHSFDGKQGLSAGRGHMAARDQIMVLS